MTCINDVRLVGRLAKDVEVTDGSRPVIRAQVETFQAVKDRSTGGTKWLTQTHSVVCFRENLADVMRRHGKAGRFVKVLGQLKYDDRGRAEIVVGFLGELGMMNSVGAPPPAQESGSPENSTGQTFSRPRQQIGKQQDRSFHDNGADHGGASEPSWQTSADTAAQDDGSDDIPF